MRHVGLDHAPSPHRWPPGTWDLGAGYVVGVTTDETYVETERVRLHSSGSGFCRVPRAVRWDPGPAPCRVSVCAPGVCMATVVRHRASRASRVARVPRPGRISRSRTSDEATADEGVARDPAAAPTTRPRPSRAPQPPSSRTAPDGRS
eukprot:4922455-Prymnesium_polylepis.1